MTNPIKGIYQKLVELQEEAERLTGIRPHVEVSFHVYPVAYDNDKARAIRDYFVGSSSGSLDQRNVHLECDDRKWTCYKAEDERGLNVNVHGPSRHESAS